MVNLELRGVVLEKCIRNAKDREAKYVAIELSQGGRGFIVAAGDM